MSAISLTPRKHAYTLVSLLTLTHITEFQLLHTPAAFQAERIAWRYVIYLNLIRSVRRCIPVVTPTLVRRWLIVSLESLILSLQRGKR